MTLRALSAAMVLAAVQAASCPKPNAGSVPKYALDYAPIVYLDSRDTYLPSDIGAQLTNTHVSLNNTKVDSGVPSPLTLSNLDSLNSLANSNGGHFVYLSSNDDYTKAPLPAWLHGVKPDSNGKTNGARSAAIIVNDKGNNTVDVYYMYFYAYNQGNTVFDQELGDHVGDWEHNMIRFVNGQPSTIWYSEHGYGQAFDFKTVNKYGNSSRPVAYSGNGTHASWPTSGDHDHNVFDSNIPRFLIIDHSSQGPVWDPTLSAYYYSVSFKGAANGDSSNPTFTALSDPTDSSAGAAPVNWLYFTGQWGDNQLPASDSRQKEFFSFYKYTAGPTGPRDKDLNRVDICPKSSHTCTVKTQLT